MDHHILSFKPDILFKVARYFIFLFLLINGPGYCQGNDSFFVSTEAKEGWILLDSAWKFSVGDELNWADPDYDDSHWQKINLNEDFDLINEPRIPNEGGIIWFRAEIYIDSTLEINPLVLRILQSGASEFYLDGKLIHKLGVISTDPKESKFYDPRSKAVSFPAPTRMKLVMAIRFQNMPASLPLYSIYRKSYLNVVVSTMEFGVEDPVVKNRKIRFNRWNITVGVTSILCILYLTFFIFFPSQKINLYFSLSCFFHSLFMITITSEQDYHQQNFIIYLLQAIFQSPYVIFTLFCFYKIFDLRLRKTFWTLQTLAVLSIPLALIFDSPVTGPALGVIVLFESARIGIISVKRNKGAWIILIFAALSTIYWTVITLSRLSIINVGNVLTYLPFGFLLVPLSLAIYLGYSFGMISVSLRKKLVEVEQLSNEKQHILSEQNITLEKLVDERTLALNQSIQDLKSTQTQLIHAEKMASLGELTSGIAHEIQNPLNFVNNFSEVSSELIKEINEELESGNIEEVKEITADIKQNLNKINHHGQRASSIVKSMLEHSKSGHGQKEITDINRLVEEYLKLAYHGFREKNKIMADLNIDFNTCFKTNLDVDLPKINVIPTDFGRVLLNLIDNALYACAERSRKFSSLDPDKMVKEYVPIIIVSTRKNDKTIEISVQDNGNGVPKNVINKIFQPFFTTKPTGQGTGLGLSLSYDIITKGHDGHLEVETEEGQGTRFIIQIPIKTNASGN